MIKFLCIAALICIFLLQSGCVMHFRRERTIHDPSQWGDVKYRGVYELKEDASLCLKWKVLYTREEISSKIDQFQGREFITIESGNRIAMRKLIWVDNITHSRYRLLAEIMDGDHAGAIVALAGFAHLYGHKPLVRDEYLLLVGEDDSEIKESTLSRIFRRRSPKVRPVGVQGYWGQPLPEKLDSSSNPTQDDSTQP